MKPIHAILALYTVQQLVFAAIWLAMAWLRMARRSTLHWGVATALLAASMSLVLARPWLPAGLGSALPNLIHLVVCWLILRGIRLFVRRPPDDAAPLALVATAALVILGSTLLDASRGWTVVAAGLALGILLVAAADDIRTGLAEEFGRVAALACSLPLWIIGTLLAVRGAMPLVGFESGGRQLDAGGDFQVLVAVLLVVLAMAMHFGIAAMVVLRLVSRLRHLSMHDALTQLLNRRAFAQRVAEERARQQRSSAPLALLAVDLDHFKSVNDRLGHAAGDAVLVAAAGLLRGDARGADAVARTGGEEFAVLLPDTDLDGAHQVAVRLLEAFRQMSVDVRGEPVRVTASIGAAVAEDAGVPEADLFRRADRALYLAKEGGRDRVVCAGVLSAGAEDALDAEGALRPRRIA